MTDPTPGTSEPEKSDAADSPHVLDSRELFGETREIRIRHGDDIYRLRITLNNKLILQK